MENDSLEKIKTWLGTGSINLFGRPFAGKDTQGKILADIFDAALLGGGDILRGSTMPDRVKEIMKTGKLIPTEDYISIVLPYLSQEQLAGKPLVLSSVGRWHGEEDGVIGATDEAGHELKAVIYLKIDEDIVRERWRKSHDLSDRGVRHDDTEDVLEIRLAEYREKTLPVIEFYRDHGMLIEIDATATPDVVTTSILTELSKRV